MLLPSEMQIRELRAFVGSKKGMCLIVSLILLLHFLLVVSSGWNLSSTVDINRNLNRAYNFFSKGNVDFGGPSVLAQGHLFGFAPIILGIDLNDKTQFSGFMREGNNKELLALYSVLDNNEMNKEFYEYVEGTKNDENLRRILRASIIIEGLISVLTAFVIFSWAKQAFGIKSGYVALLLYSFSPFGTSLVHGLHADNLIMLFATLTFFYFWRFLMTPNKKNMILTGAFLGVAMVVKITTVFFPVLLLITLLIIFFMNNDFKYKIQTLFKFRRTNKYVNLALAYLLIILITIFVINALFLFKDVFKPMSEYNYEHHQIGSQLFLSLKNSFIGEIPLPITPFYILAVDSAKVTSSEQGYLFFIGEYFFDAAPKTFYLASFLVKTTLPVLILFFIIHLILILIILSKNNEKIKNIKFNYFYLLFLFYFIFIFVTIITNMVAGLRHLGILYPLIFIIISSIILIKIPFSKYIKIFVWALVGWHIIVYLLAYPFFIPYFNEIIGNNNGYLYFRDTNIDYHEAYYHAIDYKKAHPEVILFPPCLIEKGKVSMSPNDLNFQRANCYGWLKNFEPVDFIANSWPVYEVDGKWVQDDDGQSRFLPSANMKPRKAKINPFLKGFV